MILNFDLIETVEKSISAKHPHRKNIYNMYCHYVENKREPKSDPLIGQNLRVEYHRG